MSIYKAGWHIKIYDVQSNSFKLVSWPEDMSPPKNIEHHEYYSENDLRDFYEPRESNDGTQSS